MHTNNNKLGDKFCIDWRQKDCQSYLHTLMSGESCGENQNLG